MVRFYHSLCALLVLIVCSPTRGFTEVPFQTLNNPEHFSIQIPEGWKSLSRPQIEQYTKIVGKLMPALATNMAYVYQSAQSEAFTFPYVTVIVKKTGAVSVPPLESLADEFNSTLRENTKDVEGKALGLVSDMQLGEATVDEKSQMIRMKGRMNVVMTGTVLGSVGIKFFRGGYVQVNCYAPSSEFKLYADLFDRILRSVSIESGWEPNSFGKSILPSFDSVSLKDPNTWPWKFLITMLFGMLGSWWKMGRKYSKSQRSIETALSANISGANVRSTRVLEFKPIAPSTDPDPAVLQTLQSAFLQSPELKEVYHFEEETQGGICRPTLGLLFQEGLSLKAQQDALKRIRSTCMVLPTHTVIPLSPHKQSLVEEVGNMIFPAMKMLAARGPVRQNLRLE